MKNKIKSIISKIDYRIVILIGYAIITFILALKHEPWRDEAQNYLLVRDLSFIKVLKQLKYEGHPFLWYLILKPFALIHIPYDVMRFIPWIIANIIAYLLLKKSKMSLLAALTIMFSPMLLFYGSMLFRSYILAYLLLVIFILLYDKRFDHPMWYGLLLFAMLNTHILLAGFVIGLLLVDIYEMIRCKDKMQRRSLMKSGIFCLIGFAFVYLQFHNTLSSTNRTLNIVVNWENVKVLISTFGNLIFVYYNNKILYLFFYLTLCACVIYTMIKKHFKMLFVAVCGIGFMVAFSVFVYNIYPQMVGIIYMILLALVYTLPSEKGANLFIVLIFILILPLSFKLVSLDIKEDYTDSINTAHFIEKNIPKGSTIYALEQCYTSSVIAHLKKNDYHFKYILNNKPYTYADWKIYTFQSAFEEFAFSNRDYSGITYYLGIIRNEYLYNEKLDNYDIIYMTQTSTVTDERYLIYKFKEQE